MDGEENPLDAAERLMAEGRPAEAAKILAAGRGGLLARLLLAKAYLAAGDVASALETARETAFLNPDLAAGVMGLGEALLAAEALPAAICEFQRALRIDPALDTARFLLGKAWLAAGETERALAVFTELPSDLCGLAQAIAAAEAMRLAPRSDAGYVRHLFDQFSGDYDARMLGQLRYRAPQILRELYGLIAPGAEKRAVLDLGCGTGLGGAAFRDVAARLDGVDLSPKMLEKAKARGIYDLLTLADLETPPVRKGYDLALAADTLVYIGDLKAPFSCAHMALKTGGFFLFTVERWDGDGFELGPKRRWRHSEGYLRRTAEIAGFDLTGLLSCVPRVERGVDVPGFAVAIRKKEIL
jgi:predicted TPR repeat methyltransferase